MEITKQKILSELSGIYPPDEALSIARLVLSKVTGYNFTGLIINKNTIFSDNQREEADIYLKKLIQGEPVQYVLGETEFFGLNFTVNKNVLIPRPETEELVDWVIRHEFKQQTSGSQKIKILDIGTGSGCIPISIKHHLPDSKVYACDISFEALRVARLNAELNKADVHFFELDILSECAVGDLSDITGELDVVVSNPPYIPFKDKDSMEKYVTDFEPSLALFVSDDDPLLFYRCIAQVSKVVLKPNGQLFFEIHRDFGKETVNLLTELGFTSVELKTDMQGNERMIKAIKPF